jgi:hypothetical protein
VEGHFLVLLGDDGGKINFSTLLGAGGKVTFLYCWGLVESRFLILLGVGWGKFTFPLLLRIARKSRFSYCWKLSQGVESHFLHVGNW